MTYRYESRQKLPMAPLLALLLLIPLILLGFLQLNRSLPPIDATTTFASQATLGQTTALPLPTTGASSVAVEGLGPLGSAGPTTPRPIASVTKMMTAYVILQDHPLRPGESGPDLTMTAADEARYQQMIVQDQSALPVAEGQVLSQLQLMEGMLVPSANNFAEILAAWDAGSETAFVAKMNAAAQSLGMTNTFYADTSGFLSATVSTPTDQVILARKLMQNPAFANIVAMQQVELPGIGVVDSTNELLGTAGVVGIKTGYTEEAGGNLAFAARRQALGQELEIVGAVFGQVDRPAAFAATQTIVDAVATGLQSGLVVSSGDLVATFDPPWSDPIDIVAGQDVTMMFWPGMSLESSVEFSEIEAPLKTGEQVGWLNLRLGEQQQRIPIVLADDLPNAGFLWRLTRF